jgi:hypothetical protein
MAEFIDPLCVSALNTPACEASGQVFLRVLQDSLFSGRGGSNLLLPRTDLGALLPWPRAAWSAGLRHQRQHRRARDPAEAGRRAGARAAGAGRRAPSHHHRKARHLRL